MKNSNKISLAFGTKIIVCRVLDSIFPISHGMWDDLMSSRVSQKLINENNNNKNENISKKRAVLLVNLALFVSAREFFVCMPQGGKFNWFYRRETIFLKNS